MKNLLFLLLLLPGTVLGQIVNHGEIPQFGQIVTLHEVEGDLRVPTNERINSLEEFSVLLYIEYEDWGDNFATFANKAVWNEIFDQPYGIFKFSRVQRTDRIQMQVALSDSSGPAVRSDREIPPGERTHVAATFSDDNVLTLYIEGEYEESTQYVYGLLTGSDGDLFINAPNLVDGFRFNGTVEQFLLFDRALTGEEIRDIIEWEAPEFTGEVINNFERRFLEEITFTASGGGFLEVMVDDTVYSRHTTERKYFETLTNLSIQYPDADIYGRRSYEDRVDRRYTDFIELPGFIKSYDYTLRQPPSGGPGYDLESIIEADADRIEVETFCLRETDRKVRTGGSSPYEFTFSGQCSNDLAVHILAERDGLLELEVFYLPFFLFDPEFD